MEITAEVQHVMVTRSGDLIKNFTIKGSEKFVVDTFLNGKLREDSDPVNAEWIADRDGVLHGRVTYRGVPAEDFARAYPGAMLPKLTFLVDGSRIVTEPNGAGKYPELFRWPVFD